MLHYDIKPKNLGAHLIAMSITVPNNGERLTARLPKWIPGSYKIRDYSRFIQTFVATDANNTALHWHKTDSDTWVIETPTSADVTISYDVYAYDLSVRGAYLDDTRLFFNHCCVAFDIVEFTDQPRIINIASVDDWRIFTALEQAKDGHFLAGNYNHQIDCPVESASAYKYREFILAGVTHEVIFTGAIDDKDDIDGMTKHIENICAAEIKLFGGSPLDKYLFLNYIEHNQYGGLEHKHSVAQVAAPDMMMKKGQALTERMIDFLGLCSHEYFHLWNVKRLQPKDFQPYDLYREQHTEMLWFFEGMTSYYDELFLLRAGVVDAEQFLTRQAQNLSRVLSVPGRLLQPLVASSYDAWTKLYQADHNSPNNMISYYSKGAVFALYLDLFIRQASNGKYSTDDMMRYLWSHFGEKGIGIDEDDVFKACVELLPDKQHGALAQLFINGLHTTKDLPISDMLKCFDIDYQLLPPQTNHKAHTSDSGMRIDSKTGEILFLNANSQAASIGISVDDKIIAINQLTQDATDFNQILNTGQPGEALTLTVSRRGRVYNKTITLSEPEKCRVTMTLNSVNTLNKDWLAVWK